MNVDFVMMIYIEDYMAKNIGDGRKRGKKIEKVGQIDIFNERNLLSKHERSGVERIEKRQSLRRFYMHSL